MDFWRVLSANESGGGGGGGGERRRPLAEEFSPGDVLVDRIVAVTEIDEAGFRDTVSGGSAPPNVGLQATVVGRIPCAINYKANENLQIFISLKEIPGAYTTNISSIISRNCG